VPRTGRARRAAGGCDRAGRHCRRSRSWPCAVADCMPKFPSF
jgi:hypothetical protein